MSSYTTSKEYCIAQTVLSPTSLISVPSIIPSPNAAGNYLSIVNYWPTTQALSVIKGKDGVVIMTVNRQPSSKQLTFIISQ